MNIIKRLAKLALKKAQRVRNPEAVGAWLEQNPEKHDYDFNCENLVITSEMLNELEETINNKNLPETSGFFFGQDSYEDYSDPEFGYKDDDEQFIKDAREAIKNGDIVEYSSWW